MSFPENLECYYSVAHMKSQGISEQVEEESMIRMKSLHRTIGLLGLMLALVQPAFAVINSVTYVAGWDSIGSGNPVADGGPGLSVGQKVVIRISYDDFSTATDDVTVLDAFFSPSGNFMRTIELDDPGNSLDIFVPMEGLDTGGPFIYQQNETDHFPAFIPVPTLNFVNGSSISLTSNIIGLAFEGNFVTGGNFNVIKLFNTSPSQPDPPDPNAINMVSQILNCGNTGCTLSAIAANDTNGLTLAVDLIIDSGPDIVYDAANLTKTTSSVIVQSNDLGAARSDNEDFIDASWSQTGTTTGTNLNDVTVGIINSKLTNTTDISTWNVTMTEQITFFRDPGTFDPPRSLNVSYKNVQPTLSVSATESATGVDFVLLIDDMDLVVNALIENFEILTNAVLVDETIDATTLFSKLFKKGTQFIDYSTLLSEFGFGLYTIKFSVIDLAGAIGSMSLQMTLTEDSGNVIFSSGFERLNIN